MSLQLFSNVVKGTFEEAERGWVQEAFSAWDRDGRKMPLERYLFRMTPAAHYRRSRNEALRRAHDLCPGATSWPKSVALAKEISCFENRIWRQWQNRADAPFGTSQLRVALFEAFRAAAKMDPDTSTPAIPRTANGLDFIVKHLDEEI